MSTSTLRPARRTEAPPPARPALDPEALAERWLERMPSASDHDLATLLEVLSAQQRSVVQNIALARAKAEQTRRGRTAPATRPAPKPVPIVAATPALRSYRPMLAAFEQQLPPAEPKRNRPTS